MDSIQQAKRSSEIVNEFTFPKFELKCDQRLQEKIKDKNVCNIELKSNIFHFLDNIFQQILSNNFKNDLKQLSMYYKHDFVLIETDNPLISNYIPDIFLLFKEIALSSGTDRKINYEIIQRLSKSLESCEIYLNDCIFQKLDHYYFLFLIDRNTFPSYLIFLGYYLHNSKENIGKSVFIDSLVRSETDYEKRPYDVSKMKKDKNRRQVKQGRPEKV